MKRNPLPSQNRQGNMPLAAQAHCLHTRPFRKNISLFAIVLATQVFSWPMSLSCSAFPTRLTLYVQALMGPTEALAQTDTKDIAAVVWARAFGNITEEGSLLLAEQIHGGLNKNGYSSRSEGKFFGSLAYLHLKDNNAFLSSPAFLQQAGQKWPQLGDTKEAEVLWKAFKERFDEGTSIDDTALQMAAGALQGSTLRETDDSVYHFYLGLWHFQKREYAKSLVELQKVALTVEHYRRAKFMEALIHLEGNRVQESREAFQIVVSLDVTAAEKASPLRSKGISRLRELGVLNLARLSYEEGQFLESLAYYRTLMQESAAFHESLTEQGWAFFMAGYPNRAFGAQYAAVSPFFRDRFNPDAYFLGGILQYWMCHFEKAQEGIGRFVAHTTSEGDELKKRIQSWANLAEEESLLRYAKLYDDARIGVSSRNIGLGSKTIASLLLKDAPMDAHNAASFVTKKRLGLIKPLSKRQGADRILKSISTFENELKIALGRRVRLALSTIGADFEKSLDQARLLYLEILTARKDALLGKQRSVKGQEFRGVEKPFEEAFGNADTQKWAQDKNEFWFDELGFYVFQVQSQCGQGVKETTGRSE
jgi:tetratricopeptide (TPR) repeat protein